MKHSIRRLAWVAVALAAAWAGWSMLRAPRIPVDVAVVDRGLVEQTVEEEGETRVIERYTIAAPVTGRLRRLSLREGDMVAAGQTVAVVEPAPLDARAYREGNARLDAALDAERIARAELESARTALAQAQRDRERTAAMSDRGLASPAEREKANLAVSALQKQVDAAGYRVKVAEHEVEVARAAISPASGEGGVASVTSPVCGRVLHRFEQSERVVSAGTPLLEVGDVCDLEVVVDLLSTDAVSIRPGDTVEVMGWGGDSTLVAIVRLVEPSAFTRVSALGVEEQRVNVIASLADPPATLGDRFRVDVRIVLWRTTDVVRAPRGAVFRAGAGWRSFVVDAGRVRERILTVGHTGDDHVEVTGGLAPGDLVVMYPDERIRDGVRVTTGSTR